MINSKIFSRSLDNGIKVIVEEIGHISSVSAGIWLKCGSRFEDDLSRGYFHFVEHMLFKGTAKRTNEDIVRSIDKVGGQINASTNQELTSFYIHVINSHFEMAIDILSDMILNSLFHPDEIEKEKKVVLEEIKMTEDAPEELCYELFFESILPGNNLGHPILGRKESIENLTRQSVYDFYKKYYTADNITIAIAGNINPEKTFDIINQKLGQLKISNVEKKKVQPVFFPSKNNIERDLQQIYFTLGLEALNNGHEDKYTLSILNSIFGGSMSSRLFQNIREKKGLVYSIFSTQDSFSDFGITSILGSCSIDSKDTVLELIKEEISNMGNGKFSEEEIQDAKEFLKGNMALLYENTEARMYRIAKSEFIYGRYYNFDEMIEKIDNITYEENLKLAKKLFKTDNLAVITVGKNKLLN